MILKLITQIARILVGALFVFSGFVKLVDPIGSQYKFQEYFSVIKINFGYIIPDFLEKYFGSVVLEFDFLIPYALPFAILLIVAEILLGVMVLIGYKPKFTVFSLFILTLVFLFLTWYSAYYNKVTDCGCFGDAIKLSTWETFYKNIILIGLIIVLLLKVAFIKPIFKGKIPMIITFLSLALFLFTVKHVLTHLPLIDFRAYAIGKNIPEGMVFPADGSIAPVHDFMLEDAQADLAPELLRQEKVMLVIVYNLDKADVNGFRAIKEIGIKAKKKGYTVYGVSASFSDDLVLAKEKYNLPFDFLFCDETTLKTMIRANPGVIILNKGTVVEKKNWVDVEEIEL
ncbi:putative membrane protein YphA (DoxX/SURF4 family) [Polaribacter sp. Hel1_33_96]|uniref:MauE/DoxX family redox-associated membrane protein n=1 Tax=Polaribacter sp. Hel1_33_96 TaxID=1336805 RepID=UPI000C7034A4|nr:MauE/DoxX family redox-associated membrane protein [Polaribacter sp. Hel1_33_96]PKV65525.1 putative membrane protein YphA (DoxX/SURF4 family) [Polaribacter sp. Hel1_33_96]